MSAAVRREIEFDGPIVPILSRNGTVLIYTANARLNPLEFGLVALLHANSHKLVRYPDFQEHVLDSIESLARVEKLVDKTIPLIRRKFRQFHKIHPTLITHFPTQGYVLRDFVGVLTVNHL